MLNGGSLAGAVAFGFFLLVYYLLGMNPFGGIKLFGIIIPIAFMYLALKRYREEEGEGYLKFGQGLVAGIIFTFVYSSLSAMMVYLFGVFIDGGFLELFIQDNLEALGQSKEQVISFLGKDTYEEMVNEFQQFTVGGLALSDFQSKTMGSFIVALILSAILQKKPPTFDEAEV
jgi:hypothetical protein